MSYAEVQDVYVGLLLAYSIALVCVYRRQSLRRQTTHQQRHHITEEEYLLIKDRIATIFMYISRKTNMCS